MAGEKGRTPDYKGDGIACWVEQDKNGKKYLSVQLFGKGGIHVAAFKYEPKPKQPEVKRGVYDHEA